MIKKNSHHKVHLFGFSWDFSHISWSASGDGRMTTEQTSADQRHEMCLKALEKPRKLSFQRQWWTFKLQDKPNKLRLNQAKLD